MDLTNEKGSGGVLEGGNEFPGLRSCADCRTTTTPLWRGGPSGPKSLCNACGIRYRKKRRALLGLKEGGGGGEKVKREKVKREKKNKDGIRKTRVSFKLRLFGLGRDVFLKQRSVLQKQRILGEEEEAAVLLMALSSGFL